MTVAPRNLLAVLLTCLMVGAQTVCGCPANALTTVTRVPLRSCAGARPCCKHFDGKSPTSSLPGQSGEPCEQCNLSHRIDQVSPDQTDVSISHDVLTVLSATPPFLPP